MMRVCLLVCALSFLGACALPASDARVTGATLDREDFPLVAQTLVRHCGTLDCHGQRSRNMRLYGSEGLRWSATDTPQAPTCSTPDEYAQDYDSVVGLEPEVLEAVAADGGARPERLTLVRKARGAEEHKGGAPFLEGDAGDRCLTSWLRGQIDRASCLAALPDRFAVCVE